MRRAKIVATLGPATDEPGVLERLLGAGVDVVRLNAAHAGPGELATRLRASREAAEAAGREIGVLLDLPGPKLRIGKIAQGTVLEPGRPFRLLAEECEGDATHACVTHAGLADDLKSGDRVLLDDGRIELAVQSTARGEVHTEVVTGGPLVSGKGINVPGVTLSVEPITRYDRTVLAWALANEVDWIGQSFVRSADDIEALREYMTSRTLPIVAKVEKHEAVVRLEDIVSAADAVMVARGDLGVELPVEQVPVVQRRVISAARAAGKPVIVATEMLDSMRTRPRPTRAEASDVANAVFGRADAVMLSGETAIGSYPVESVETMSKIVEAAEGAAPPADPLTTTPAGDDVQAAVSAAVAELGRDLELAAIVTLTQSGATAFAVSRHRPLTPVIAATPDIGVARRLALAWGVTPLNVAFAEELSTLLDTVVEAVRSSGHAETGQRIAITAGLGSRIPGGTDFVHVRVV